MADERTELVELRQAFEEELDQDADYIYGEAAKAFFARFDSVFASAATRPQGDQQCQS